ncbi:MAG: glycosyltransferase family 2 protein [Chloroflexi bacterium]|nr:MAG: glycosyltransferase family 2 protein [Chloroflexota bacterium]
MPNQPYLSVLMPALNEGTTIDRVLDAVLAVDVSLEVILVDDGSTDDTWHRMQARADGDRVRAFRHAANQGKGAAIRTALREARGELVIIQDADLEYDPADYHRLIDPIINGRATVVFGTRAFAAHTAYSYWYVMGNRLVTLATNLLYNVYLSDMETGYKVMPRDVALALDLEARGFELEPEITAKLLRSGHRIYEVPVEYAARSRAEGKKLTAMDGARALVALARYRAWRPAHVAAGRPVPWHPRVNHVAVDHEADGGPTSEQSRAQGRA